MILNAGKLFSCCTLVLVDYSNGSEGSNSNIIQTLLLAFHCSFSSAAPMWVATCTEVGGWWGLDWIKLQKRMISAQRMLYANVSVYTSASALNQSSVFSLSPKQPQVLARPTKKSLKRTNLWMNCTESLGTDLFMSHLSWVQQRSVTVKPDFWFVLREWVNWHESYTEIKSDFIWTQKWTWLIIDWLHNKAKTKTKKHWINVRINCPNEDVTVCEVLDLNHMWNLDIQR